MTSWRIRQPGSALPHSEDVLKSHQRALATARTVQVRRLELRSGAALHAIEAGEGPRVLHLHGSSTSSLSHLPLLTRAPTVGSVAVDRPGFGLSPALRADTGGFQAFAVGIVADVLDALAWPSATLAGASMGGAWALWFALAHPERVDRLVLLGSTPLLPGTRPPLPLRVMTTPVLGDALTRAVKPNARTLQSLMASVGERGSLAPYPWLVDSLVAGARDRTAATANLAELRAILSPAGFRPGARIRADRLRRLSVPTLLIWGTHDPVGSVAVARSVREMIPSSTLELLDAGHVPWLRHPDRVSQLLTDFVHDEPG